MIAPISVFFLLPLLMYCLYHHFYHTHMCTLSLLSWLFITLQVDIRDNPLLSISCVTYGLSESKKNHQRDSVRSRGG